MGRPLFCKVKSHRGETLNEPADDLADLGRTIDPEQAVWTTRCNQIVFSWIDGKKVHARQHGTKE